jgi:hypothetical protein
MSTVYINDQKLLLLIVYLLQLHSAQQKMMMMTTCFSPYLKQQLDSPLFPSELLLVLMLAACPELIKRSSNPHCEQQISKVPACDKAPDDGKNNHEQSKHVESLITQNIMS